jgi:hypothetical protein
MGAVSSLPILPAWSCCQITDASSGLRWSARARLGQAEQVLIMLCSSNGVYSRVGLPRPGLGPANAGLSALSKMSDSCPNLTRRAIAIQHNAYTVERAGRDQHSQGFVSSAQLIHCKVRAGPNPSPQQLRGRCCYDLLTILLIANPFVSAVRWWVHA